MALTQTQQQTLVETDRGTPMGELFRRYWIPAFLATELPEPDCDPVQIKLLGENLLGFRDTNGTYGLVQEFCPHRGVSLFYGRNEDCGIRCAYHGWKFDVDGKCVDMPSEPDESNFKDKVRIAAYPLIEQGGVLWAYMGPADAKPPEPKLEWALLPPTHRYVSKRIQECNYLQALEGGIDSSHVSVLHRFNLDDDPMHVGAKGNAYLKADSRPKFEVQDAPNGLLIGAKRGGDDASDYWRITPFIMPWYTIIPPFGENVVGAHAWVPIDDENCWTWSINYEPIRPLTSDEVAAMDAGMGIHVEYIPGTFRPVANRDNHYLIDRQAQKGKKSFSGVKGISMQDASLQESMGRIQDRTTERLGTSDAAIIATRRTLLRAAEALADDGTPPIGLEADAQYIRSVSMLIPKGVPFAQGAADAMRAEPGKPFVSLSNADTADWERRVAAQWTRLDDTEPDAFIAAIDALAAERTDADGIAPFESACARDSTGHSDLAVPLYREALERGLTGERRRRTSIQLASSLRNIGRVDESIAMLTAERARTTDALDDAVAAALALAYCSAGRDREAASLALSALAPHLPRYQRSMANYARLLVEPDA